MSSQAALIAVVYVDALLMLRSPLLAMGDWPPYGDVSPPPLMPRPG